MRHIFFVLFWVMRFIEAFLHPAVKLFVFWLLSTFSYVSFSSVIESLSKIGGPKDIVDRDSNPDSNDGSTDKSTLATHQMPKTFSSISFPEHLYF
jgi:hypothetical protein